MRVGGRLLRYPMLQNLSIDLIIPCEEQPRKTFHQESLEELAQSIAERGVLEPIVVRPMPDGRFQIIMGERRYRASKLAGLSEIPAIIRDQSDEEARADALLENFQREDLNPVERARAIEDLLQFTPMDKVARILGVTEATVRRHLEILELPTAVLEEMYGRPGESAFAEGHARVLRALSEDPVTQVRLARKIREEGLSIDDTQRLVQAIINIPDKKEALLRVPLNVAQEIIRQTARERGMKRTRPFRPQTAQTQSATLTKALNALGDILDPRMVSFLSEEERSPLLASCATVADALKEFTQRLRACLTEDSKEFEEVYINCALCGRIELIGTPRCSVCWSVMKRCDDCGHYDKHYQQCSVDDTHIPSSDADTPTESSRSYRCENYSPRFEARKAA